MKTTTEHEHDRLAAACESLLAAVAPEYTGDIPTAIEIGGQPCCALA